MEDNKDCTVRMLEDDLMIDVINAGNEHNVTIPELAELITQGQPDSSKMKTILHKELITLEDGLRKILDSKMIFLK